MKFEIAFDFENASGQFQIDIERLVIKGGEQGGDAIALLVTQGAQRAHLRSGSGRRNRDAPCPSRAA